MSVHRQAVRFVGAGDGEDGEAHADRGDRRVRGQVSEQCRHLRICQSAEMAGRAGTFASGQGMFEEVPPSRIVDGALAVSMGHIQNGFDIGPDLLGRARLVVPDRLDHAAHSGEVDGADP